MRSAGSAAELDEVDLIREPTPTAALAAVHAGQADWAAVPPDKKATRHRRASIGYTLQSPLGAEEFFGINLASPTFANPLFRRAIIMAVNRNAVVSSVLPGLEPSAGVVPAGVPGSVADPCGANCDYSHGQRPRRCWPRPSRTGRCRRSRSTPTTTRVTWPWPTRSGSQLAVVGHPGAGHAPTLRQLPALHHHGQAAAVPHRLGGAVALGGGVPVAAVPLDVAGQLDRLQLGRRWTQQLAAAQATASGSKRQLDYQTLQTTIMADYAIVPMASFTQVLALANRVHDYAPRLDGTFNVNKVEVTGSAGTTATTGK